jgi:hypothetical protein
MKNARRMMIKKIIEGADTACQAARDIPGALASSPASSFSGWTPALR